MQQFSILTGLLLAFVCAVSQAEDVVLEARTRAKAAADAETYDIGKKTLTWDPKKTAITVCDMWDKHWCEGATRRVGQMAPRMAAVLADARKKGVLIIHCPSDTMKFYEGMAQRKLAQDAPKVETAIPLKRWCFLDKAKEGELPIDDSDNGCDCQPKCKTFIAWKRQIETIPVEPGDAVTDSAEAFYLMKQRGIENVIVMGVHTNMCVLGRPFSIRQMAMQGMNVTLMRDMTDTMYNPKMRPFVDHFTGTDLVVEHVEKYWCPTITSGEWLKDGVVFKFPEDKR